MTAPDAFVVLDKGSNALFLVFNSTTELLFWKEKDKTPLDQQPLTASPKWSGLQVFYGLCTSPSDGY